MDNEISLSVILEMIEMEKKKAIDNSSSFVDIQEELKKIEDERKKVINGDKEAINRVIEKYNSNL